MIKTLAGILCVLSAGVGGYSYYVGIDWSRVGDRAVGVWQTDVALDSEGLLRATAELHLRPDHGYVVRGVGLVGGTLDVLARGLVVPCRKGFYDVDSRLLEQRALKFRCNGDDGAVREARFAIREIGPMRLVVASADGRVIAFSRTAPE